jgi:hypothetical protein
METITYVIQVSACTGIFYLFYHLFLRRLTFFTINRWYLLATLLISFAIPAIKIQVDEQPRYFATVKQMVYIDKLKATTQPIITTPRPNLVVATPQINWAGFIELLYLVTLLVLFTHLVVSLLLFVVRLKGKPVSKLDGVSIFGSHPQLRNGSFFNYIFLNDEGITSQELKYIIAHELLHVRGYHSADRLIVKLAQIALWFNPFIYLYIKSIEANHEFEVDHNMTSVADKKMYANLLLQLSATGQGTLLINGFSTVPIGKRIKMLFNKPSKNMRKLTYLLAAPMVLVSCLAFATSLKTENWVPIHTANADEPGGKYRQKVKRHKATEAAIAQQNAYKKTDDFKNKSKLVNDLMNHDIVVKIVKEAKNENAGILHSYVIEYNGSNYGVWIPFEDKTGIADKLKEGDEVTMKMSTGVISKDRPVTFSPAYIIKDNIKIYEYPDLNNTDTSPFLYETNRVRFTNGKITDVKRDAAGKWIGATIEKDNGYKFNLTFKANAPNFTKLKEGDKVTLRFVHEMQTGDKTYTVNDWVAISGDIKDYGIKNPDFFYRFYEKI